MTKKYPFKFLDAYQSEDAQFYFGREKEIDELYEMTQRSNLIMVYGTSGTGKTSLVQCGLASKFQSHDWFAINIRHGGDINRSLENALDYELSKIPKEAEETDSWLQEVLQDNIAVIQKSNLTKTEKALRNIYLNYFRPVYLIFDQFEELFILGNEKEEDLFVEKLVEITSFNYPITCILVTREEYLGHFYNFEQRLPQLFQNKLRVEPMTRTNLHAVLSGVADSKNSNVTIEKGKKEEVADLIFGKLQSKKNKNTIQLPYLQVFLDNLYIQITNDQSRKSEAIISIDELNKIGNIDDVLKDFLFVQVKEIKKIFNNSESYITEEKIWNVLKPLTTVEGTKEPLKLEGLLSKLKENGNDFDDELVQKVLLACVEKRIIRFTEDDETYEVAHDALAKTISEQRNEQDLALIEIQKIIESKLALGKDENEYLTKKQLELIQHFSKQSPIKFEPLAQELIAKSKRYHQRIKRNKILIGVFSGLILAGFLGWTIYSNIKIRKINEELTRKDIVIDTINTRKGILIQEKSVLESNLEMRAIMGSDNISSSNIKPSENEMSFKANADYAGFYTDGKPIFRFELAPADSINTRDWNIIYYKLKVQDQKKQMRNSLYISGRDKNFKIDYDGYECVLEVYALIEYLDPKKLSKLVRFNMCELVSMPEVSPAREFFGK